MQKNSVSSKLYLYMTLNTVFIVKLGLLALKMNGYTFRGSNSVIFIIASHINWGHLIKERIRFHQSKFFPLRVDPILGRLSSRQANKVTKLSPFKNMARKEKCTHIF